MIEIRKAVQQDAEELLEFCKLIGGETDNLTFGAEGIGMTVEEEERYLDSVSSSDKKIFLLAVQEGRIVGTCGFSGYDRPRLAHRGEISLAVKKSMWGKHIGIRLLEKAIEFIKDTAHAEIVSLEVRSDNKRAIALYEKFGFVKTGCFEGCLKVNGEYADCDIMCLCLGKT